MTKHYVQFQVLDLGGFLPAHSTFVCKPGSQCHSNAGELNGLGLGYFVKTGALALIELNAMDNFDTKLARLDATGVRLGRTGCAATMENQALYKDLGPSYGNVKLDNSKGDSLE